MGGVAKWLGSALQKRLRRFDPGHHLQIFLYWPATVIYGTSFVDFAFDFAVFFSTIEPTLNFAVSLDAAMISFEGALQSKYQEYFNLLPTSEAALLDKKVRRTVLSSTC